MEAEDGGRRQRSRVWLWRLVAVVVAGSLTLLLAEGAARVAARVMGKERALVFDAELGWRPLPNLSRTGEHWGVNRPAKTNSHGWRDAERAMEKPTGKRRIVLLGDSFAFGLNIDDGDRMSDLLEKSLHGWEVLNMGVTAWGTDQQLRALETEGFAYSPDLVLLLTFPGNDLQDIRCERNCAWPKPHYDLVDGDLRLVKPVPTWDVRLRSISFAAEFVYRLIRTRETDERVTPGWETRDTVPLYAAIVRRMAALCRERGVSVAAVIAYPSERLPTGPTDGERGVRAALEESGFATCDTLDMFREHADKGESLYGNDNMHWNGLGNRLAADAVREMLLDRGMAN